MIDSGFDSVDIGGGWGGWEGGWGGWEGGWGGGGVDIGGYWGGWEGGVVVEPGWGSVPLGEGISYGGGYGGSISSDLGFDFGRETPGLGYDDRWTSARICVQGGVPPKCPEGQTAVWDQNQCKWVCSESTAVCLPGGILGAIPGFPMTAAPDLGCPEGQAPVWDALQCKWVCKTQTSDGGGGGGDGGGDGGETPLDRVADVIERVLAGGGGGIIIPQVPQPQAVVAPTTERRYNPAAIVLLVAGLALGGYYVYQRTRRS
jgi:hypothetical protein